MADKKNWKQISEESLVRAIDVLKEAPQLAQGWYVVAALAQIAESYAPDAPAEPSEPETDTYGDPIVPEAIVSDAADNEYLGDDTVEFGSH
jgi:hypothetical protein